MYKLTLCWDIKTCGPEGTHPNIPSLFFFIWVLLWCRLFWLGEQLFSQCVDARKKKKKQKVGLLLWQWEGKEKIEYNWINKAAEKMWRLFLFLFKHSFCHCVCIWSGLVWSGLDIGYVELKNRQDLFAVWCKLDCLFCTSFSLTRLVAFIGMFNQSWILLQIGNLDIHQGNLCIS